MAEAIVAAIALVWEQGWKGAISIICVLAIVGAYRLRRVFHRFPSLFTQLDRIEERQAMDGAASWLAFTLNDRCVLAYSPNGECIRTSPQWTRYSGLTEEQSRGHSWLNGVAQDQRKNFARGWRDAIGSTPSAYYDAAILIRDESFLFSSIVVTKMGGAVAGILAAITPEGEAQKHDQNVAEVSSVGKHAFRRDPSGPVANADEDDSGDVTPVARRRTVP